MESLAAFTFICAWIRCLWLEKVTTARVKRILRRLEREILRPDERIRLLAERFRLESIALGLQLARKG